MTKLLAIALLAALSFTACGTPPDVAGADDDVTMTEGAISGWPYCPQKIVQLFLCPNGTTAQCWYGATCAGNVSCPQQVWGCTGSYQSGTGMRAHQVNVDCIQVCH